MRTLILLTTLMALGGILSHGRVSTQAAPDAGPTERVSISSGGQQGNGDSELPDVSADGRFITFASAASNLVANDSNGHHDIFVHDRETGQTGRVSQRSNGEQANGDSFAPTISGDGRYVAFFSLASNLVDGDTNGNTDIFVHDRQTGQTELVSVVLDGTANGDSREPDISGDGRYIVFTSSAGNLVGGDTNLKDDIFRWDRVARLMERISVDSNEVQANDHSLQPAVSGDGQHVVFASTAGNLVPGDGNFSGDIFLREVDTGLTSRVSISSSNVESNGDSWDPHISADGQYIVFVSLANNLAEITDGNGYADVFLRNLGTGRTRLVSLATDGSQANDWSEEPSVSAHGRYVTFQSYATNLATGDIPGTRDVFIRDRQADTLLLASINSSGTIGDQSSREPVLAANGRYVVFSSKAANLVPGDTNDVRDIFLHDYLGPPTLTILYRSGAPGSYFPLGGEHWVPDTAVAVQVNGIPLGSVNAGSDGELSFQLISSGSTQHGLYIVTAVQGSTQLSHSFVVDPAAPLRPGTGAGFVIPDNSALTPAVYLPVIRR